MTLVDLVDDVTQNRFSQHSNWSGKQNREKANLLINDDFVNVGIPKCFLELLVTINKNRSKN